MPKKLNQLLKTELSRSLAGVASGILVDYQGLPSDETFALRRELKGKKIKMLVLKNSVATLAFRDAGVGDEKLDEAIKGPLAICYNDDPVQVASALVEYRRKNRKTKLAIKGGLLDRRILSAVEVQSLAALPSKPQLYAQLAGTLNAPIYGLVQVTAGILRKLLYALKGVREQKEKEGGEAAAPAA